MELAGQWRREWAGTAEYGKVTEGGVTRRVARAMEVLNASAPGARVRVMRAAYHSTSGPGVPASSYMLHSSRRVISSGFNLLESPTYPTKPLEISSTPLESSPDSNTETEKYEVTEPDDIEISEPSKWRSATNGSSLRMPSEESSSTDNASIIDLDSRVGHKGLNRKYSYDSENSDINSFKKSSTRASPLLDAPVALSTLKYKSLLNGSSDWNNRRKSYSFEDTSPLNEIILQSNDTLAMESSTDSGICKSSEIVNDFIEDTRKRERDFQPNHEKYESTDKSFSEWHTKNRFYKTSKFKPYEHDIVVEEPRENNIALQSKGKVSINVPITLEDDDYHLSNNQTGDDSYRRVKRVGFCKTELHFAAESGKVNIIATDEKPPPTNDFRKRRSAFVSISDKFEKPITLFGDKGDFPEPSKSDDFGIKNFHESEEIDENTAATKSILKNKIPKPKPYLLGENMGFGDFSNKEPSNERSVQTGVSLINKQLQTRRHDKSEETFYSSNTMTDKSFMDSLRTTNKGPIRAQTSDTGDCKHNNGVQPEQLPNSNSVRSKFNALQMSPVQKPKTRQLRESELTYFGVDNHKENVTTNNQSTSIKSFHSPISQAAFEDNTFESVRLIKQISNSAQNSEAESDDSPDYQNIPMKNSFAPIPTPRSRVKYKHPNEGIVVLRPIIERANETTTITQESRRSRSKRQEAVLEPASRSLSEPAKKHSETAIRRHDELRHSSRKSTSQRYKYQKTENDMIQKNTNNARKCHRASIEAEDETSLYANVGIKEDKKYKREQKLITDSAPKIGVPINSLEKNKEEILRRSNVDSLKKRDGGVKINSRVPRTEKLSTPEYPSLQKNKDPTVTKKLRKERKSTINDNNYSTSSFVRNKSAVRPSIEKTENNKLVKEVILSKVKPEDKVGLNHKSIQSSKNITSKIKESRKNTEPTIIEHAMKSKDLKAIEKVGNDKDSGSNGRKTSLRSEYVIKYDDKNGTVSSISKVRAGHGTSRKKHSSKERNKEMKTKDVVEKSALLQLPDRHRLVKGRKKHSIWNTRSDLQRTCEIL